MTNIIFPADERAFLANISQDDKTAFVEVFYNVDLCGVTSSARDVLFDHLRRTIILDIEFGHNSSERIYLRKFMSERSEDDDTLEEID